MAQPAAITVQSVVKAPIEKVWEFWTKPEHIVRWAFASSDWEAPAAENDLRIGGKFKTTMAAKDKSASFDFTGAYTNVKEYELIEYNIDDGRHVKVEFSELPQEGGVKITETFEPENENPKRCSAPAGKQSWTVSKNMPKKLASINHWQIMMTRENSLQAHS